MSYRLPRLVLFFVPDSEWRKPKDGRNLTWQKGIKGVTKCLSVPTHLPKRVRVPFAEPELTWCVVIPVRLHRQSESRDCCLDGRLLSRNSAHRYLIKTSISNTDASMPYSHDLFESLIVKKRIKPGMMDWVSRGTLSSIAQWIAEVRKPSHNGFKLSLLWFLFEPFGTRNL
ncbi:hypothetical protein T265_04213 [Opisthorchis viverrini]|uniref:Uncharacterized protein n=1 Tax=Opisthorchis viverrini TaxID=6198 RepID=A0A075AGW5_OPIVI|nr:hypothetical protein T265_04213 [Opisthorchis viverrini]KER29129.1 hypothetical protein T265_04213 [Opisthorchis viverrini]